MLRHFAILPALLLAACSARTTDSGPPAVVLPATVSLPAGTFLMGDATASGSADELPVHRVQVSSFALARYEVTVGDFRRFAEATGYRTDAERNAHGKQGCALLDIGMPMPVYTAGTSWRDPGYAQTEQHPVVCLSYADVQAYIAWFNDETGQPWRLPTEAEWEYAARAGATGTFPWGESANEACRYANGGDATTGPDGQRWPVPLECRDGYLYPAPVGQFAPNAWGVYDLIGNVWEYTADCYAPDFSAAPTDGSAVHSEQCAKRAMRGGAWPYPAGFLRIANRGGSPENIRANDRGFRLALLP